MKLRCPSIATLPLLGCLAALASAQSTPPDAPPPIKMGLWQSEVTTTMAGGPGSPTGQAMGSGHTVVTQGCLTPDTWKKDIQGMHQRMHDASCTVSNFQQDPHRIAFDEACSSQSGYSNTIHFEMLIDDTENGHGHADMKMNIPSVPQGMSMHMNMKTKFLSADCGDVKPGEGKVIHE